VPIIAFYCESCNEALLDAGIISHVVSIFGSEGSDAWFQRSAEELLLPTVHCPKCGSNKFRKETDILDVWFDSGSSHEAVLGKRLDVPWPADVYIEGSDQYRGWFHSSLLVGVGVHGRAPYRQVLTHGWTLDSEGRAMSKSLGNVIEPQTVVESSGAEILRLWVASSDFKEDVKVSKDMITRLSEAYRKFRNTARFILGNIFDFSPSQDAISANALSEVDQWALMRTHQLLKQVYGWYENYEFHRIYHAVYDFATIDLSSLYFDILKDRLYTASPQSHLRRSSQTALYKILNAMTRALAPIYSFTCDEIWQYLPQDGDHLESVHMADFVPADQLIEGFSQQTFERLENWEQLIEVRSAVLKVLEKARKDKFIGNSLEAKVKIHSRGKQLDLLREYESFLPTLFIVSQVQITEDLGAETYFNESDSALRIAVLRADGKKCERCWNYTTDVGKDKAFETVCQKCSVALRELGL
jgi:isoleucyl-tRNA synthetase